MQAPIIVKIVETPERGISEILVDALGLTGVLAVAAIAAALALGALLFWLRSRRGL